MKERASFGTRLGAIAATVGSAVGLGNIWRFPYEAGQNGGGAYILVYIACVIFLGIPIILSEFIIGRSTHKTMMGALKELKPKSKVYNFTYVCIAGAVVTLGFYSVVCGWVVEYLVRAIGGGLSGHSPQQYSQIFNDFTGNGFRCVIWTLLFLAVNFWIVSRGVKKGIEGVSSFMMPLLFLLLIIFCVNSLLLPNSGKGLEFLLYPDFSHLTWKSVINAMGQSFMSLSLGVAMLITYSSYFSDKTSLTRDAVTISALDTLVAILAGVVIFPAVFSFGIEPQAGPKLIFEVLPGIFQQMAGGYIWAVLFFVLLLFASITSTISISEVAISFFIEQHHMSRNRATLWCAVPVTVIALLSALSFNVLSDVEILGMNLFDLFNYAASNVFMIIGGMFTAVFVGWFLDKRIITEQLTNRGTIKSHAQGYVIFCLRYVAPVTVCLIFLFLVGLI